MRILILAIVCVCMASPTVLANSLDSDTCLLSNPETNVQDDCEQLRRAVQAAKDKKKAAQQAAAAARQAKNNARQQRNQALQNLRDNIQDLENACEDLQRALDIAPPNSQMIVIAQAAKDDAEQAERRHWKKLKRNQTHFEMPATNKTLQT